MQCVIILFLIQHQRDIKKGEIFPSDRTYLKYKPFNPSYRVLPCMSKDLDKYETVNMN